MYSRLVALSRWSFGCLGSRAGKPCKGIALEETVRISSNTLHVCLESIGPGEASAFSGEYREPVLFPRELLSYGYEFAMMRAIQ
jgi:hypothetical protein